MKKETPPTQQDINPHPGCLDGEYAVKNWLDVTVKEGGEMLADNALHFGEDFMYFGPVAFKYYMQSAIDYARSDSSEDDSDFASAFVSRIKFRFEEDPQQMKIARDICVEFLSCLIADIPKFSIDGSIYGNVEEEAKSLLSRIEDL